MLKRLIVGALALFLTAGVAKAQEVVIFAAASTANAVSDLAKLFEADGRGKVIASFAASSTLAKQIEQGAPAHLFLSADTKWADYLADRGLIATATRCDLLTNRLALVAPADSTLAVTIAPGFDLARPLGDGRLATGDPDHVPVGGYAKQALQALGAWRDVEPRLARADSVRAALAMVERGEVPLGIVYSTDAAISPQVRTLAVFPADSHSPVVYPLAMVAGDVPPAATAFYEFLKSPAAAAVFRRYGFQVNG